MIATLSIDKLQLPSMSPKAVSNTKLGARKVLPLKFIFIIAAMSRRRRKLDLSLIRRKMLHFMVPVNGIDSRICARCGWRWGSLWAGRWRKKNKVVIAISVCGPKTNLDGSCWWHVSLPFLITNSSRYNSEGCEGFRAKAWKGKSNLTAAWTMDILWSSAGRASLRLDDQ